MLLIDNAVTNLKTCFTIFGLTLTIVGAAVMARGELTSLAARIKQSDSIAKATWYQDLAIWLARRFGSKDSRVTEDYVVGSFTTRFWGFFFLVVGTILQVFGAL